MNHGKRDDALCDEGFAPCRNERCEDEEVHPAHEHDFLTPINKNFLTTCPECDSIVIRLPGRRAMCSSCSWRGANDRRRVCTKSDQTDGQEQNHA